MNQKLFKIMYRSLIKRSARAGLTGRNRDRHDLSKGRFTQEDVDNILSRSWQVYDQLSPLVPREPKLGNRMNVLLACVTLACLRTLIERQTEREYAIELIGDVAWKIYEKWGRLPILAGRIWTRDPRQQLRIAVNIFLRFPFTPPGYRFERLPSDEGIALDMLRCPVMEYFDKQQALDLCTGTWCDLDFALAEMWGGSLERTETLATGCERCNFHFKARSQ